MAVADVSQLQFEEDPVVGVIEAVHLQNSVMKGLFFCVPVKKRRDKW